MSLKSGSGPETRRVVGVVLGALMFDLAAACGGVVVAMLMDFRMVQAIVTSQVLAFVVAGIFVACRAEFDPPEDYGPSDEPGLQELSRYR
ncbi:hypothetical protein [Actinocorallia longicatena]|uniref:Uncharacterized protein n=1 Tax=Actinocorallia longicatena TaxID=111803 RepID=A0ABP6QAL9_9ACTN